jgi:hypothetical protein
MLSRLGVELRSDGNRPPRPITRPPVNLPDLDDRAIEAETRQAQARVRVIRADRDAWEAINKAQSFDGWLKVGTALAVGKAHARRVSGARTAWGRNYSREFNLWVQQYGFERMPASTRSVAVELHEHAEQITQWRDGLPERQRRRLNSPLAVTRRWKAATGQYEIQRSRDLKWDARTAWRKFCACLQALPPAASAPLWQSVAAEASAVISKSAGV